MKRKYSILFIGNSYTYYNDMPKDIFKKIAESAEYDIDVDSITKGGYKLCLHADPNDEYGQMVEKALQGTKKYDYVILQEQSVLPASEKKSVFYDAVRNLSERIRATGATPILYSTWGRKIGHPVLEKHGWTNEVMTNLLAESYRYIGDELEIAVAYVGLAFYEVYTNHTEVELYNDDKTHPSYAGSYLAAVTLFARIFDIDPTSIKFDGDLSNETADILRKAARNALIK